MKNISLKQLLIYIVIIFGIFLDISFAEKLKDGLAENSDLLFDAEKKLFENVDYSINVNSTTNINKEEITDFNKALALKFKKNNEDLFYFSLLNYNNFFDNKTRKINSKNLNKNYYSLYKKDKLSERNKLIYGASFGYLPFEEMTVSRYMLFFNLYSKFGINDLLSIDFTEDLLFVNIISLNISKLYSNKYIYKNKNENYSKFKDLLFIIYRLNDYIDFKNGISYSHELGSEKMLKLLGYRRKNSGKIFTGFEFNIKYFKTYFSMEKSFQSSEYKFKLLLTINY